MVRIACLPMGTTSKMCESCSGPVGSLHLWYSGPNKISGTRKYAKFIIILKVYSQHFHSMFNRHYMYIHFFLVKFAKLSVRNDATVFPFYSPFQESPALACLNKLISCSLPLDIDIYGNNLVLKFVPSLKWENQPSVSLCSLQYYNCRTLHLIDTGGCFFFRHIRTKTVFDYAL